MLTLAISELATNAVKYGALSVPHGKVTVCWRVEKRDALWFVFDWTEEGTSELPKPVAGKVRRQGFGAELIEGRIPYEIKGRGQLVIEPGGARCHLEFPLQNSQHSRDERTAARRRFGGGLDMRRAIKNASTSISNVALARGCH